MEQLVKKEIPPYLNLDLQDLEGEEWRPVVGFEESHIVSNHGRVKHLFYHKTNKPKIVKLTVKNKQAFCQLVIKSEGVGRGKLIYKSALALVGEAFIRGLREGETYYHKDKNKTLDNRVENICIGTYSESHIQDVKDGKHKEVCRNPMISSRKANKDYPLENIKKGELYFFYITNQIKNDRLIVTRRKFKTEKEAKESLL